MTELRLLSYNLHPARGDTDAMADEIRRFAPDVVAVREAPRALRWRSRRAMIARKSGLVVATADRPGGVFLMTTLAVRVLGTRFAVLPRSSGRRERAVAMAQVELRGARWVVAAVTDPVSESERTHRIEPLAASFATSPASLVVAATDPGPTLEVVQARR